MAVTTFAIASAPAATTVKAVRKPFSGLPVARVSKKVVHRTNRNIVASAQTKEKLVAAVTAASVAMMANPLVAEAAVTPSLKNLLLSVVAGGSVLGIIAFAITAVSNFDPIKRG